MTRIPCKHAIAAIRFKRADPKEYVDTYFSKNTYLMCCSNMIHPMPHESRWSDVEHHVVAPPQSNVVPEGLKRIGVGKKVKLPLPQNEQLHKVHIGVIFARILGAINVVDHNGWVAGHPLHDA